MELSLSREEVICHTLTTCTLQHIHAIGIRTVDQQASKAETLRQTSEAQTSHGEDFAENCNEPANDIASPQRPAEGQNLSPCATSAMDDISDQFADADETEEVVRNDQPVQTAVGKSYLPRAEATDQYQEPAVKDTALTKDIENIHLPQPTASPSAFSDADDVREDLKAVFKAEPNQLKDGAAYTSPVSGASVKSADKPKVGSETVTIEKPAYPVDSTTEETTSPATQ